MPMLERLRVLHRLCASTAGDSASVQRAILELAVDALGVEYGFVGYIDGDRVVCVVGAGSISESIIEEPEFLEKTFGAMAQSGASVLRDDIGFLGAPFQSGNQQFFLSFVCSQARAPGFSESDRVYVETLGDLLARLLREQQLVEEITHLRFHDRLTGLALETPMRERIAADAVREPRMHFAVFAIDIDIARILEQYDYAIAATLLAFVARRLEAIKDFGSLSYRGTACDFFIVASSIVGSKDVEHVANRIQTAFATPFSHGGHDVSISVHVGAAVFPGDQTDAERLVGAAVDAVKEAKAKGKSRPAFASAEGTSLLEERRSVQRRLKNAIECNELALYYQPYVDFSSREIVGAEALVRWPQDDGTILAPDQFLPVLEGTDAMLSLGSWVMSEAARMAKRVCDAGHPMTIAFNVSPSQLQDPGFIQRLKLALVNSGDAPTALEIEITESAALSDPHGASNVLLECRRLGLKIALDDFGTGYSSLVYLRQLPADVVKIDRSFVGALPGDMDCEAIAGSIIALAHRLGRLVQAEGIETESQWNWLRAEGCDLAQGYYVSYPLPESEFLAFLPQHARSL